MSNKLELLCPNCENPIITWNAIEVVCPSCQYVIQLERYRVNEEIDKPKRINLNEVMPK